MDTNDKTMKNEIHRLQERILLLEQNDKLTGLMHNTVYLKKIDELLAEHPDWEFSLIYFSIKNLKLMNIQQGTHYGDRFLCHIAAYLQLPQEKDVPILVSRVYAKFRRNIHDNEDFPGIFRFFQDHDAALHRYTSCKGDRNSCPFPVKPGLYGRVLHL